VECKALRGHGHALVELLGKRHAYQRIFNGKFHFGNAGVEACIHAIRALRSELFRPQQPRFKHLKRLKQLRNGPEDVRLLLEVLSSLEVSEAELLLLSYAAAGHAELLRALLETGACSVDARREKDGCTSLHIARYRQHAEAAEVLLEFGADPDVRNKFGETPTEAAQAGCVASSTGM